MDRLYISNIDIGLRIKQSRISTGLTQEDLADKLDKSKQFVSDIECGRVGMSINTLIDLCTILNVSSDFILFGRVSNFEITPTINRILNLNDNSRKQFEKSIDSFLDIITPYNDDSQNK